jgi:glycosyltransferase involved in cell wall biosynthesis
MSRPDSGRDWRGRRATSAEDSGPPPGGTVGRATGPLISIVIPVHAVAAYIGACLDSVLGQNSSVSIEVIAIDDASPDRCGEILDQRATCDERLTVLHLGSAGGPGNARNAGLAAATGRYVWFVDGDDLLPPGAVAAVTRRLGADQPDVLLIDYAEIHPDGSTRPSSGGSLLTGAPGGVFSLGESPELINLTMTGWSKLFRREFLIGLGEPFRPGIHEDIPVTCAALFAGRLTAVSQVCYLYRRSRPGSFMATTSERHWAIFGAYEEVLARLDDLAEAADPVATPAVRSAVFERAMTHYAAVLQTTGPGLGSLGRPGLLPRADRRRFFARMHADFVRYRPPGYRPPSGPRGAKLRLIEHGAYWPYELLEPVNKLRVAVRRILQKARSERVASLSRRDRRAIFDGVYRIWCPADG